MLKQPEVVQEKGTTVGEASAETAKDHGKAVELKTPTLSPEDEYLLDSLKIGVVVLDGDRIIKRYNPAFVRLLKLADGNLHGQTIQDAGLAARLPELASNLERSGAGTSQFRARLGTGEKDRLVAITVKPILDGASQTGILLQCEDATLQEQFENTVNTLQATSEDLEAANEELQVTNEELEATNDELQSTNEELATTNEELQSLNEELQTTNLALEDRTEQMDQLNRVYAQTLERIGLPAMIVNQNGRIDFYNRTAARLLKLKNGQQALQMEKLRLPASLGEILMRKCRQALKERRRVVVSDVVLHGHINEFDLHFNAFAKQDSAASVLITFEPSTRRSTQLKQQRSKIAAKKSKKT